MSRKLRIEYPGAMYHVMNRGDQREDIFRDDEDRQRSLSALGEACQKTEWQVHAYCLMRNHFRQELLAAVVERVGPSHYGAQRPETGVQKAERIVKEEIGRLGWEDDELRARRKGHRAKVMLARRLRRETTMSLKWIAQRLQMGSWTYVSNLLNQPAQALPSSGGVAVVSIVRTCIASGSGGAAVVSIVSTSHLLVFRTIPHLAS